MSAAQPPIAPAFLVPGDPVAVAAPSGVVDPARIQAGMAYLEAKRHPAHLAPGALERHGYLAGHDESRAGTFNDLISTDESKAILLARGGYGLGRILSRIDLEGLRRRPRQLVGYSDATALFMALQRKGPYLVHYGPLVSEMGDPAAFDEASFWSALYGEDASFTVRFDESQVLRPGRGAGRLLGGCLSVLVTLLGTPHDPDYDDAILFWEDVAEEPYRIDRMLAHLRSAGKFDRLRGMIIGSLSGCEAAPGRPSLSVRDVVLELTEWASFPIVWNVRAGHVPGKITLPLGLPTSLSTYRGALTVRPPSRRRRRSVVA